MGPLRVSADTSTSSRGRRRTRVGLMAGAGVGVLAGAAALVTSAGPATSAPAVASGSVSGATVVVNGLAFPDPTRANLSFVGCASLYQTSPETLQPMVGRGPGAAPSGDRSMAFDLAGGNAVGARFAVDSVARTTVAGVTVHADGGSSSGVAYVAYQDPAQAGTGRIWVGRAPLSTPGGSWQTVDASDRAYSWAEYDETTHAVVTPDVADGVGVDAFTAAHGGDGPGFYTIGFGCDGQPFNIDDFTVGTASGVTTYDLEGLTTSVAIRQVDSARAATADSGGATLKGALSTDTGNPVPGATLLLERSDSANGPWSPAGVVPVRDGVATATVTPDQDSFYRWRFVDRPLASGSVSPAVAVAGSGPSASPSPSSGPSSSPSDKPSSRPSSRPSDKPSATTSSPVSEPSGDASPAASPSATPNGDKAGSSSVASDPSNQPSSQPSSQPSGQSSSEAPKSPTGSATASSGAPSGAASTGPSSQASAG